MCSLFSTWTPSAGSQERLPMSCVNWYEAYAFCIWDGGFLPSQAEWEYAAAGGSQQREYPWGSTDPGTASQYAIYGDGQIGDTDDNCYYPSLGPCIGVSNIAPVGTPALGAGLWGHLDLAGNVEQWVLDCYPVWGFLNPCTDCVSFENCGSRMVPGGLFDLGSSMLINASDVGIDPMSRQVGTGFRCARTP
jgi:formylglycine-generating enzyme required for sulfatase activity